jgi:hypothetical protein
MLTMLRAALTEHFAIAQSNRCRSRPPSGCQAK